MIGLALCAVIAARTPARADVLYGVSDNASQLITIDRTTGATLSSISVTGTNGGLEDIIPDGQGQLLLAAHSFGAIGSHTLFQLNPTTGVATPIGDITNGAGLEYWVEGMTLVNGQIYASAARIDISSGSPIFLSYAPDASDTLIRIDPATGHATEIGRFGPSILNIEAIAYSPRLGMLVGSDIGTLDASTSFATFHTHPSLVSINPTTGLATVIANEPTGGLVSNPFNSILSPAGPFIAGLSFSPDGNTLYGATIQTHFGGTNSGFVTVDATTGAITPISTVNLPILDGIAFPTAAVPEPSSLILLGTGLAAICGLVRTRSGHRRHVHGTAAE
jgi:PEP-CTERM motif